MNIITKYNNKILKLDTSNLELIGSGGESKVYSHKDIAIKIHKDLFTAKSGLSYDLVKKLKKINTQRILMPLNPIYEKTNIIPKYKGYTTKLITNIKNKAEIINIDSNHLYNEIKTLISDVELLSSNKILIKDIVYDGNIIFNDNIYFVDPGSYYIDNSLSTGQIKKKNMKELNFILYYYLICLYNNREYIMTELKNIGNSDFVCDLNTDIICSIYAKGFRSDYSKNQMKYIKNIIKILEKYDSIKYYKYNLLKDYVENGYSNPEHVKTIKKILS